MSNYGLIGTLTSVLLLVTISAQVNQDNCEREDSRDARKVVQEYLLPKVLQQSEFELPETCLVHPIRNMCVPTAPALLQTSAKVHAALTACRYG